MNSGKKVLFAISTGTETIEFSAPFDILKRAGADITIAKVKDPTNPDLSLTVTTAQGLKIQADTLIEHSLLVHIIFLQKLPFLSPCILLIFML